MRILIIGAGSMGSVFGGFLSKENDVTLIGRKKHVASINKSGLHVSGIWGEHSFNNLNAYESTSDIPKKALFDLIMITTKSYDTRGALKEVRSFVKSSTAVMSMQNGIGNEDLISEVVGEGNTMGGMAIFGARLIESGHVEVTVYASECLVGDLIGGATERAVEIAQALTRSGIPTLPSDNIIRDKWMKAFYNIALNPLSAILGVPYGVLGEKEETKNIIKALLKEAFSVADALDIPLKVKWNDYYRYLMEKQLPPTASHKSSMLQDIVSGKKTEVDYLNGAIVGIGKRFGIKTPVNQTITGLIKALERRG